MARRHFLQQKRNRRAQGRNDGEPTVARLLQLLAAQVVDRFHILKAGRAVAEGPVTALLGSQEELAQKYYL